jgi:hypothetical protein
MIEATLQMDEGELIGYNFHVLPAVGDIIKVASAQPGPIRVSDVCRVVKVIHLITPKLHESGNYHLINIVGERV